MVYLCYRYRQVDPFIESRTLSEAKKCKHERIEVDTIMVSEEDELLSYVESLERQLKGRAYYINPANIDKILINDFISHKKKILISTNRWWNELEENYDKQKMLETLVDPDVSSILLELENGSKNSSYLTEKLKFSDTEIQKKLSYVIQHDFVKINKIGNETTFTANKEKLNKIMESDENFSGVVDGLTELDSFLN